MEYSAHELADLAAEIKTWGRELGFQEIAITGTDLRPDEARLQDWLDQQRHGSMEYMARHGTRRSRPDELVPGTRSVISGRMDYFPADAAAAEDVLDRPGRAYVSRYALGRDYHKVLRGRLKRLAARIAERVGPYGHRVFVDSAPVLEKALARNAGLGWIGKHTNLINRHAGSWFFLGELYTDLPLPVDAPVDEHCGSCRACLDVCPTNAIVAPYELDARLCISYQTIENRGAIPESLRTSMGNRIYGCDDCQLFCPWNKFARASDDPDFTPRHGLDDCGLIELFAWTEGDFDEKTRGSPIRRIGYACWLRNIAVALGNQPSSPAVVAALEKRRDHPSPLVREHVSWALERHDKNADP